MAQTIPGRLFTAITAGEDVVPASELAAAIKQIRELQRLLGKKTMENEILKEAVEVGRAKKWIAHASLLPGTTIKGGEPSPWCIARSYPFMFIENLVGEMAGSIANAMTAPCLPGSWARWQSSPYGYRRVWALLRRQSEVERLPVVNAKRVYRVMRDHGLLLERNRRFPGSAGHIRGGVAVNESNRRWCSDGFEFRCDNGENPGHVRHGLL